MCLEQQEQATGIGQETLTYSGGQVGNAWKF